MLPKDHARFFSDLYDRRQTSDYDDFILCDQETTLIIFNKGKEFVSEIKRLILKFYEEE
jgi:uncharacterized protein (UPF0332 family)